MPEPIILLDLNFTFVSNSKETFDYRRGPNVDRETYRTWLLDLIRPHYVIMITARTDNFKEATMEKLQRVLNWQPQEAYFKPYSQRFTKAPDFKRRIMEQYVLPKHGKLPGVYLALESNAQTRAMYAAINIHAVKVPVTAVWEKLPKVPANLTPSAPVQKSIFD